MTADSSMDPRYLELDRELAALDWVRGGITPSEVPVARITERALFEHSLRSLGDFAFHGMGQPAAEITSILLGGQPMPGADDYRI